MMMDVEKIKASFDRGTHWQAGPFFLEKKRIADADVVLLEKCGGVTLVAGRYRSLDKALLAMRALFDIRVASRAAA